MSQRGSLRTLVSTAISRADRPGFNFSSNVPDKEWLTVALTHHSQPVVVEGKPPLSPSCSRASVILLREKSIPNTEGISCITREVALPLCPPKEDISGRPWPRTVMAAASPWIFYAQKFFFCSMSIVGTSAFHLASLPLSPLFLEAEALPSGSP